MKKIAYPLLVLLCVAAPVYADDGAPSQESLQRLLQVTDVKRLFENVASQTDVMMKSTVEKMLEGKTLSIEERNRIDAMTAKIARMLQEELDWDSLEPLFIKVYKDSFTQSEVDGMLAFYESPSGRAVIKKLPLVMQNSMAAMQEHLAPLLQKAQQMAKEGVGEVESGKAANGGSDPG